MPLGNSGSMNHYNKVPLSVESIFTPQVNVDMFDDPFSYEEAELVAFNNEYQKRNTAPWHAAIRKVKNAMESYVPTSVGVFSNEGFHAIMRNPKARDLYINSISKECFGGNEHMRAVFETTFKNSVRAIQHHSGYQPGERGLEGYDATAIHSNRSNFNGCLAFTLVGYFARCKVMEIFHPVENGVYPEYDVEYYLAYARHPQTGELLPLPKSQRNGALLGAFDLPTICSKWSPDNPHVIDGSERGTGNTFAGKEYFKGTKGLVKFGYKGNCIIESGYSLQHDPLNDNVSITEIWYKAGYEMKGDEPDPAKPIYKLKRVKMRAGNTQGEQRLRVFSGSVILEAQVIETDPKQPSKKILVTKLFEELITGRVNLDTGDYAISAMSNGEWHPEMYTDHRNVDYTTPETLCFAYKLDAKMLDAANLRGGLRFTRMRIHETLRTEYTCMGTIAISPYVHDEWNIGGNQQTGYVAVMTDEMSKQYAITRDLNGEKFLMEQFQCTSDMYICTQKFGSFVRFLQHDVADVGALGGGDPFEMSKKALRLKITNIFSRAETHLNMPGHEDPQRAVPRNWVGIGPERVIEAFPDIQFETLDMTNNDQVQQISATQKYGFNIEGGASFRDSLNRYTRLIGCKDERWLTRDLMFFLKSTDVQFPTLLYYAFMYRIFSGIDPYYTNLPSILFYGRDNMFALTQCMVKMAILNQDENTYTKMNNQARTRKVVEQWNAIPHSNVGNTVLPHEADFMKKVEQFNKLMVGNKLAADATYANPKSVDE